MKRVKVKLKKIDPISVNKEIDKKVSPKDLEDLLSLSDLEMSVLKQLEDERLETECHPPKRKYHFDPLSYLNGSLIKSSMIDPESISSTPTEINRKIYLGNQYTGEIQNYSDISSVLFMIAVILTAAEDNGPIPLSDEILTLVDQLGDTIYEDLLGRGKNSPSLTLDNYTVSMTSGVIADGCGAVFAGDMKFSPAEGSRLPLDILQDIKKCTRNFRFGFLSPLYQRYPNLLFTHYDQDRILLITYTYNEGQYMCCDVTTYQREKIDPDTAPRYDKDLFRHFIHSRLEFPIPIPVSHDADGLDLSGYYIGTVFDFCDGTFVKNGFGNTLIQYYIGLDSL